MEFEPEPLDYIPEEAQLPEPTPEEMAELQRVVDEHARIQKLQRQVVLLQRLATVENAAEHMEPEKLGSIGQQVVREYKIDKESRDKWESRAKRAMDLAQQVKESKSFPWENAANVKFPLLTTAALQFAARAYPAIMDGPRIVKSQVMGHDPDGQKAAAGDRVSQHMSYQLMYELPEWEADMDVALHQIPIVGCAFKKVYKDGTTEAGFNSKLISAFNLVVNQSAKSFETVPRVTEIITLYPHEIDERRRDGRFLEDVDIKAEKGEDEHEAETFLEQHRYLDLDDDGVLEPWIVTVHERTATVVRIMPGFDADQIMLTQGDRPKIARIERKKYFVKIPFIPDPQGGFYDVGFGHLLESLSDVIDTTINQMMDAGTLQNAGGGFIGGGVDLGKGKAVVRMNPGEFRRVSANGVDLRQAIVHMEHKGPSTVLFQLLSLMIDAGKDIAAIQDILVGDMPRNQTATATMAMIEQGLKVFTAIYKRVFRALKAEFKMIFDINKETLRLPKYIALLDEPVEVAREDYLGEIDIMPVCDPNSVTDMQRMAKANFVLEMAQNGNPHIDQHAATKRALEAARIESYEDLLIDKPTGPTPQEQITLEGALAELAEVKARVDKLRAEADKTAADAAISRAQVMLPMGMPIPVPRPQFMPETLAEQPMQEEPQEPQMSPEMMMGGGSEMDPFAAFAGEPLMEQQAGGEFDPMMSGELSPELADQIAAEQMAASDAMPGDGVIR